jgi:hypothetical protein
MENLERDPEFLRKKYKDLHASEEVESAIWWAGEKPSQNPTERIQSFLNFFNNIIETKTPEEKQRGTDALKEIILNGAAIKLEDIPNSYWKSQETIMRERGQQGDYAQFSEKQKDKWKKDISEGQIADQKASLEQWIDYFADERSKYIPLYLKYWILRSVTDLAEYDKENNVFPKRSKGTMKMFPDLNQEALGYVADAIIKKHEEKDYKFSEEHQYDISDEDKQKFIKFLETENFGKLYGWANEVIKPIPAHLLKVTEGEWVKYKQGSSHKPLVKSIRGLGTGWCTAGENTAKSQLKGGDFYVYYTYNDEKKPTIPRIAIRMEADKIAEVRGIAKKQNLDPYMTEPLAKKLEEFPDKEEYLKKDRDMKQLTEIDTKVQKGETLDHKDLIFIYEIRSPIEGFGYQKDPRIDEIRKARNPQEDAPITFDCRPDQIAHNKNEVSIDTKAYVGELFPGIFEKLPKSVENIYSSFPEGRIMQKEITIGGKTAKELREKIEEKGDKIADYTKKETLGNKKFKPAKKVEKINLVILSVKDLGFPQGATRQQIYDRAQELGLEIVPQEAGPQFRLQYEDQPMGEYLLIGSEPLADSSGDPRVFSVTHDHNGRWFGSDDGGPGIHWSGDRRWVFRRKSSSKTSADDREYFHTTLRV